MSVFKCKMCGGSLEVSGESSVATCEYCSSVQTLPKKNDEVITNLFNRANNLRIKCEFDKAAEVYEKILNEDNNDSEAHWGLVLCKYGIEYVEDPKTYKRIPTCHRTQYESVLTDVDYLAAVSNADAVSADVYKAQAEEIANLQKDILAIVKNEKPFDVFICYKETDENGKRTVDSTLANDIYYQLTQEGMKVFYAAITLEDKLGVEYEPYIFAALNSAKVMLVVGTKPEYFEAIWVKNEWSRYLKLMKNDRSKLLIPCYRDMDAYDLPEEFSHLQAQNMSKIGFVNDVVRGIKKVIKADEPKVETVVKETVVASDNTNVAPLLKRAFMFLEDGDWKSADEYCEKVLDLDPECAEAYLGKLMAELYVKNRVELKDLDNPFDNMMNYKKSVRYGNEDLVKELNDYIEMIKNRNEENRLNDIYETACDCLRVSRTSEHYRATAEKFKELLRYNYKDAEEKYNKCLINADKLAIDEENERKNKLYNTCNKVLKGEVEDTIENLTTARDGFVSLYDWEDSKELAQKCEERIKEVLLKKKDVEYNEATRLMERNENTSGLLRAKSIFLSLDDYKDSSSLAQKCQDLYNEKLYESNCKELLKLKNDQVLYYKTHKTLVGLVEGFSSLNSYKDSKEKYEESKVLLAKYNEYNSNVLKENERLTSLVAEAETELKKLEFRFKNCNYSIKERKRDRKYSKFFGVLLWLMALALTCCAVYSSFWDFFGVALLLAVAGGLFYFLFPKLIWKKSIEKYDRLTEEIHNYKLQIQEKTHFSFIDFIK